MISLRLGPGMTELPICRVCGLGVTEGVYHFAHTECFEGKILAEALASGAFQPCPCEKCRKERGERQAHTPIPLHPVVERRKSQLGLDITGRPYPPRSENRTWAEANAAQAELNRGASERMEVKILNPEKIGKIETTRVQVGAEPGHRPRLTTLPPWMKANEDRIVEQWRELYRNQGQSVPAKYRASGWGQE